jgi:hypothetical protein
VNVLARAIVVAVALFAVQALVVAAIAAVRRRANVYALIVIVACATAPLVFLAGPSIVGRPLSTEGRAFLALMHLSLGGFLFHFMTLPDRSVTLRIFVELLLAPGRTLTLSGLGSRYGVRTMVGSRLDQLEQGRFLSIRPDGVITLLPRGRRFGRFVTAGRRLFRITSAN